MTALRTLVPQLALAIKCASLTRIAGTLVEVYLGHDAGQRVLSGRISRGVADRINAVLWFSDLRGYTAITDTAAPDEVIPLLNDYADAVISSIHEAGGDVLKLIGDGVLAIFKADDPADACRLRLARAGESAAAPEALNARRSSEERPVTSVYLGLHIGDVFYGNIGSENRLDFTVIGPAVNEVSRIASMCRSVDRDVAMSADFVAATPPEERANFVSLGRFALRGVGRAQELFTLDPARFSTPDRCLLSDLAQHIGLQEALDEDHEQHRRDQQDQRGDRRDLVIAAHARIVEQQRQGRDLRHADEERAGEFVERFEEHEDGARHDAGRCQRQRDGEEGPHGRRADIARGEFQILVDRREGGSGDPHRIDEPVRRMDEHHAGNRAGQARGCRRPAPR